MRSSSNRAATKGFGLLLPPYGPANPKPGAYYLRHVGFLGAQPPAVKGLAPVEFAESPEDDLLLVEFADHESVSLLSRVLSLFRGVRDYIVERDGTEKADAVIPNGVLESMKEQATVALVLPPDPRTRLQRGKRHVR